MPPGADIASQLQDVRRRIDAAAHRSHRSPADIQLVAVSKTFPPDAVREAARAGQRAFGENKVQEALDKQPSLADLDLEWHLIGHLQSNKAKKAAPAFACIESIDSLPLLQKIDAAARDAGVRPRMLIQVDLAGEATKHGAAEDEVMAIVEASTQSGGTSSTTRAVSSYSQRNPNESGSSAECAATAVSASSSTVKVSIG